MVPLALLLGACAVPVAPQGGPQDQTPPTLETTVPDAGTVNVTASMVHLSFSERGDPNAFALAFSITPEVEGPLDFRW
jgi:hypothetical protein